MNKGERAFKDVANWIDYKKNGYFIERAKHEMEVKKMNTQETIEFVKSEFDYMDYVAFKKEAPFEAGIFQQKKDDVISLLQQGEKFRQMWEELSEKYGNYWSAFDVRKGNDVEYKYIDDLMQSIKQKYFPKGVI